jgi:hypothetical protein
MRRFVPAVGVLIAVLITAASGLIDGKIQNRWGVSEKMAAAARKLQEFPADFGPSGCWRLQSSGELDATVRDVLQCAGYFLRKFVHAQTGEAVDANLLLGPTGPISVHTPDICYSSREYSIVAEPERIALADPQGSEHEFWGMTLERRDAAGDRLRVYYAWTTGGPWSAPSQPRFSFAGQPYLYKIQVVAPVLPDHASGEDAAYRFLLDFVGAAKPYLVEGK